MKAKHLTLNEETQELELLLPHHLRRQPDYNEDEFYKGMTPSEIMSQFYYEAAMNFDLKGVDLDDKPTINSVVNDIKKDPEVERATQKYGKGHFSRSMAYRMVLQAAWMQKPYDGTDWEDTKWANNPGIDLLEADWKSRERNHGVEHEVNNFAIHINDNTRPWIVKPGKGPDNSPAQDAEYKRLKAWCAAKSISTGKTWKVKLTSAPVTPPRPRVTEADLIQMPTTFKEGDLVRVRKNHQLHGKIVEIIQDVVAVVAFDIPGNKIVKSEVELDELEPVTLHETTATENLDANQTRAGQAGPNFKPKKIRVLGQQPVQHPFKGKLVGGL